MPTPRFTNEDLSPIIRKAVFSAQVANPTVDYSQSLPEEEACIQCDEQQMMQVLTNVLKNAAESIEARQQTQRDATPDAEPEKGRISIELTQNPERITLMVTDNGAGFPMQDMQKALEPYVTTRTKGTGLGLSIVKKIIDDHKGLINIENIDGGGARVTLSFLQHCDINAASNADN
jgi:two-component system nitrogen regulation sensor histidine kinase NtrY